VRVEAETHDLHVVAFERVHHLPVVCVPDLGCFVERPRHYEVAERVVERHCVHYVFVFLEVEQLSA